MKDYHTRLKLFRVRSLRWPRAAGPVFSPLPANKRRRPSGWRAGWP